MSIIIENLKHTYMEGTPFEKKALDNISLEIKDGEFVAIIGHTGSGKSTLIQHINALLKPDEGSVIINGIDLSQRKLDLSKFRKEIGLVFQYPEYQLFEETVEKDIEFGPRNLGLDQEEITTRVKRAMTMVGLDYDEYKGQSPFELSGGQKRRVAIAGVLAMEPKILILDEPTAGLDPVGRDEILNRLKELHKKYNLTTIIVSHSMEDVATFAEKVFVMAEGKIVLEGSCSDVFKEVDVLEKIGLGVPQVKYLQIALRKAGFNISDDVYTIEEAKKEILKVLGGRKDD